MVGSGTSADGPGRAWSIGNRRFDLHAAVSSGITIGAHVLVTPPTGAPFLGQVTELAVEPVSPGHRLRGGGALLARVSDGWPAVAGIDVFDDAAVVLADPELLEKWSAHALGAGSALVLGSGIRSAEAVRLRAAGFNRHTFLCGQSGSGKTYTLGVLLEQLLLETELRIVVLDPNSDYVGLGAISDSADAADTDRVADLARRSCVFRNRADGYHLRVRYGRFPLATQALMLGLDPIADGELYDTLRRTVEQLPDTEYSVTDLRDALDADESGRPLARRIDNLGLATWNIWAEHGQAPLLDQLPDDWRLAVFDLGELASAQERSAISAALLAGLWDRRAQREPLLIVIDEAHNICPQEPNDFRQALAIDQTVNIAAEGRKYGLYLLLSSQRPQKLHVNVLSQCENLLLMHVNSQADLSHLAAGFGQVPAALIDQATGFGLGEGLVAGGIAVCPTLFRGGRRRSPEGGADIPTTWAARAYA